MNGDDSTTEANSGARTRLFVIVGVAVLLAATLVVRRRIGRERVTERDAR